MKNQPSSNKGIRSGGGNFSGRYTLLTHWSSTMEVTNELTINSESLTESWNCNWHHMNLISRIRVSELTFRHSISNSVRNTEIECRTSFNQVSSSCCNHSNGDINLPSAGAWILPQNQHLKDESLIKSLDSRVQENRWGLRKAGHLLSLH